MHNRRLHILLVLWFIFIMNQLLVYRGISIPFLQSYLDDLLVMPIVLGTYLIIMQIWKPTFRVPLPWTLSTLFIFIILFECILPQLSNRYTADWKDGIMYCISSALFIVVLNKKTGQNSPSNRSKLNI